ncbi:MAG: integron cassette protein [Gammaproteobacteria bacterium]|nr:integron cassette protein [Gammaproteobacteria bacterium]
MSSSQPGKNTSQIAVIDISPDGIWLLAAEEEHFLPFDEFPWFKKGTVEQILNVVEEAPESCRRPAVDIDLSLDSIRHPEKYPVRAGV